MSKPTYGTRDWRWLGAVIHWLLLGLPAYHPRPLWVRVCIILGLILVIAYVR